MFILYVRTRSLVESRVKIMLKLVFPGKTLQTWGTSAWRENSKGFMRGGDGRRNLLRDWYNRYSAQATDIDHGELQTLRLDRFGRVFTVIKTEPFSKPTTDCSATH